MIVRGEVWEPYLCFPSVKSVILRELDALGCNYSNLLLQGSANKLELIYENMYPSFP